MNSVNRLYYTLKPYIPRLLQIALRRRIAQYKRKKYTHIWPIDQSSATPPLGRQCWPEGKQFALVLSHDVDSRRGYDNVLRLADLEEKLGFSSQFNFVPERYGKVDKSLINTLKNRGFGIGVHGLNHDGKLFSSREIFKERAKRINGYLLEWETKGFTAPSMIRKKEWMHELDMDYCTSTFDTDPFEPQPEAVKTIFPFLIHRNSSGNAVSQPPVCYLELPYTLPQDHLLFVILQEKNIDIWKKKLDWIAYNSGMALLNTHPDYMNFDSKTCGREEYPAEFYNEFLGYVKENYSDQYWHVLPNQIAKFWSSL